MAIENLMSRRFPAMDVLRCLGFEALVTMVAGSTIARGRILTKVDQSRTYLSVDRIQSDMTLTGIQL